MRESQETQPFIAHKNSSKTFPTAKLKAKKISLHKVVLWPLAGVTLLPAAVMLQQ